MNQHKSEVARGERFEFGKNWQGFLKHLDERRIRSAEKSLLDMLKLTNLQGKTFLDIGSGSGLFSLVARRLGAKVRSFDYDPQSVACTRYLKETYFANDSDWSVEEGSVLDEAYIRSLGKFDIVYSWGVLHHTGEMWRAIEHASFAVKDEGQFWLAIYNDQGTWSRRWLRIKRVYNYLPGPLKLPFAVLVMGIREIPPIFWALIKFSPGRYIRQWTNYGETSLRGMSYRHDLIDWVGGYPFEVAKPEQIFEFLKCRGFRLDRFSTWAGGLGCNEYLFTKYG